MTSNMSALAYPDLQIRVFIGVLACWHGGSKALEQEDLHGPCMLAVHFWQALTFTVHCENLLGFSQRTFARTYRFWSWSQYVGPKCIWVLKNQVSSHKQVTRTSTRDPATSMRTSYCWMWTLNLEIQGYFSFWKEKLPPLVTPLFQGVKGPYADHILIPQGSTRSSIFFDIKWKPIFFWLQIQNFSFKFFVVLEI